MQLKTLQIIHLTFCTCILLFAGAVLFINMKTLRFDLSIGISDPIENIAPLMAGIGLFFGPFIFNKIIGSIHENSSLSSKFTKYQTAFMIRCAFLEVAALVNIIACLITSNVLFLTFAALAFFALWYAKPTKDKVCSTLQLQDSDL